MSAATPGAGKEQLLDEFNAIVSETERLLSTVTQGAPDAGGAPSAGLDAKLDENLKAARERLAQLEDLAVQRTQAAVKATDTYVRAHPWHAVGIAAGIGLILGLLLRRR
ncbi:MAG: YqjD family protein [SAR324 cluster bacterium]